MFEDVPIDQDGRHVGSCKTCIHATKKKKKRMTPWDKKRKIKTYWCPIKNTRMTCFDPHGVSVFRMNEYYECHYYEHKDGKIKDGRLIPNREE